MTLHLESFEKAVRSLENALNQEKDEFVRDSVVQRFEYTYELAWKLMARQLEIDIGKEPVDRFSRKELFRIAAQKGLLESAATWIHYHNCRNITSHTYNENTAEDVYATAKEFLPDAKKLLDTLNGKKDLSD